MEYMSHSPYLASQLADPYGRSGFLVIIVPPIVVQVELELLPTVFSRALPPTAEVELGEFEPSTI